MALLTVIASQLPALLGFGVDAHGLLDESRQFALALLAGKTNLLALAIGAGTLLTILLLKRYPCVKSGTSVIGPINLGMKHAAKRSAGNPPAAFDAEGSGNEMRPYDG